MIKCLIVDDEPLAREAIRVYIEKLPELEIVDECENAIQAMSCLRQKRIDLIFLDIEMPEIDGITFLQMVKTIPGVIFTTAYRNYAVEAFDLDVIDYLLKPISFDRFVAAINKFYDRTNKPVHAQAEQNQVAVKSLNVKADRKIHKIDLAAIQYIESLKDYVKIVCENETLLTHDSLSKMEDYLAESGFIRIHRSYLVAIDKIKSFNAESVFLKDKELPISRTYKKPVLDVLNIDRAD